MLTHLHIKNFAIIENGELELNSGLTVVTGETGAGKSIIIDAIQLIFGERIDSHTIRNDKDRCEITATFTLKDAPLAKEWLDVQQLLNDNNEECIIRRIIIRDGRSRIFINGSPCTLTQVRELASFLIDIHGQHQHQSLLKRHFQRELMDYFAGHQELCQSVSKIYTEWFSTQQLLKSLKSPQDTDAHVELLRYQIQELESLQLKEEYAILDQTHKQLANAENLIRTSQTVLSQLQETTLVSLNNVIQQLQKIFQQDPHVKNSIELLNQALIHAEEACNELTDYSESIEINSDRLHDIEKRLEKLHELARKHRVHPSELLHLQNQLSQQLHHYLQRDEQIIKLEQQLNDFADHYYQTATKLTKSRQQAADQLNQLITEKIQTLGMPGGQFEIRLQKEETMSPHGAETIDFYVSANPGQPLQPLYKVASGGELSRIALAIHVITAQKNATPVLIFDEVDVGIGGSTAAIVGDLLRTLGNQVQVICITHLPQVASQGHYHLKVQKDVDHQTTFTTLQSLTHKERILEIARMLGGATVTERTVAHAKEMLEQITSLLPLADEVN